MLLLSPALMGSYEMTPEGRRRNAKRIALACERRGGQWILLENGRFALLGVWLHAKLRKRVRQLEPEIRDLLRQAAAQMAKEGRLLMPELKKLEPRLTVN
ncbi:MAG TPA: hypothetical protein VFL79_03640 [Terriglobia bacterium]|nr:hypothetical protein [Terriglobia bacterium]